MTSYRVTMSGQAVGRRSLPADESPLPGRTSVAVGFALLMSAHTQAQPKIRWFTTGDLVTGVLKFAQDTHPNRTLMKACVLRLPTPRCAVDKFPPAGCVGYSRLTGGDEAGTLGRLKYPSPSRKGAEPCHA
jgi:hypothetical protein